MHGSIDLPRRSRDLSRRSRDLSRRSRDLSGRSRDLSGRSRDLSRRYIVISRRSRDLSGRSRDLSRRSRDLSRGSIAHVRCTILLSEKIALILNGSGSYTLKLLILWILYIIVDNLLKKNNKFFHLHQILYKKY